MRIRDFRELFELLLFPRGILAITIYIIWVAFPLSLYRKYIQRSTPITWNLLLEVYALTVRFIMANGDHIRVRNLTRLYDLAERGLVWFKGFQVERVRRRIHQDIVHGVWILQKGDVLPDNGSSEWRERTVVFWAHGGGFGSGCSISFASAHCEVIELYHNLDPGKKQLLYFSLEYPLSPESKFPDQLASSISAYYWLVQIVGVNNIIIGGDSAGGNLILSLHKQLLLDSAENTRLILPKSIISISPWLDISLSHTPPHIIEHLSSTSDFLPFQMLENWRDNVTPQATNPRDPSISPFFDLNPIVMPPNGMLLVYGSTEVFAPVIDDWVKAIRKQPEARANLKIILGIEMPHDFVLALHNLPSSAKGKANRALFEIARFIHNSQI